MFAIAIDGPAGAGKSSTAKAVARALGFLYVDTGALYRAVGLYLLRHGIDPGDADAVERALPEIGVDLGHREDGQHVFLCGEDVTGSIRTPEVSMAASACSAIPAVRRFLFSLQTGMAERFSVVMDGRDIGTVVLPNAQLKIFLTASPEARAMRRCKELAERGTPVDYEETLRDVIRRDRQDTERAAAPLRPAEDSVRIETDDMTLEETVDALTALARERMAAYGEKT